MEIARQTNGTSRVFGSFEGELTTQLKLPGKPYALYKALELLGYFDSPGEAFVAGLAHVPDGKFSIEEVGRGQIGH